jgi:hypothetical protein
MGIVLGAGTTASFAGACVISASWSVSLNTQRLYCLGSWTPDQTIERPTQTLNLTIYSPGTPYETIPTTECVDANQVAASINPAACGDTVGELTGTWFVTSYSFSKDDAILPGQESWSLQQWTGDNPPNYVIRGIAEGSGTDNSGITFDGTTTEGSSGSVSAGGVGRADTVEIGTVSNVGGGSDTVGETGTGSVSIPYTPLYLGTT